MRSSSGSRITTRPSPRAGSRNVRFTKYATHGDYHWRQYADPANKYRRHADRIAAWITEPRVLDVGAGDGLITSLLGAIGVDNEWEGVRLARRHRVPVLMGDACALPFPDDSFDAVALIDVLEHFPDPSPALYEARRIAPVLYVATPPQKANGKLHDRFHYREWTPDGLTELLTAHGYHCDGSVLVVPDEKCMYGRFIRTTS
jgi:SAM-dependent methyltransferase